MHLGFYRPSTDKLLNLYKTERPEGASKKTKHIFEEIKRQCKPREYHEPRPLRFSATILGVITFIKIVVVDLMWILGKPILHVVDEDTHYFAVRFLPVESTEEMWETFMVCRVSTCMVFPDSLKSDSGSVFESTKRNKYVPIVKVTVEISPGASSNSMGVVNRYHEPLRRILLNIMLGHCVYQRNSPFLGQQRHEWHTRTWRAGV